MDDVNVVAGEVVEEKSSSDNVKANTGADVILNLENLIKSHHAQIEKLKVDLKQQRQMLEDIYKSDATYQEHDKKVKEANKIKLATRKQLLSTPAGATLGEKVKDLRATLKDAQMAISEYLQEYARLSGSNVFEGDNGEMMEIVYMAKLVKQPKKAL